MKRKRNIRTRWKRLEKAFGLAFPNNCLEIEDCREMQAAIVTVRIRYKGEHILSYRIFIPFADLRCGYQAGVIDMNVQRMKIAFDRKMRELA